MPDWMGTMNGLNANGGICCMVIGLLMLAMLACGFGQNKDEGDDSGK